MIMNYLMLYCGLMMFVLTSVMIVIRIKTGEALNARGTPVSIDEDPVYFWVFTIFNFSFLLFISISMIIASFFKSPFVFS